MKASDSDERFDTGDDVIPLLDVAQAKCPGLNAKRVNVDFPEWMVQSLDMEANRLGVTRHSLIKLWIADRLDHHYPS